LAEKNAAKEDKAKAEQEKEAKRQKDNLDAQEKDLKIQEENLQGVLKTAETLVNEADDKLKKSIIQRDIDQVFVAQVMLEAARHKLTEANTSLSDVHKKRVIIAEQRQATKPHSKHCDETVKKCRL